MRGRSERIDVAAPTLDGCNLHLRASLPLLIARRCPVSGWRPRSTIALPERYSPRRWAARSACPASCHAFRRCGMRGGDLCAFAPNGWSEDTFMVVATSEVAVTAPA